VVAAEIFPYYQQGKKLEVLLLSLAMPLKDLHNVQKIIDGIQAPH
jgi:hypothetical protein